MKSHQVMIKIKYGNNWVAANEEQVRMFNQYRSQNQYREAPFNYDDGAVIFRENNDPHNGICIRINQHTMPICDWNDVKIFLVDQEPVDWHRSRDYQTWAFYDYIYDNKPTKTYISKGTDRTHETDTYLEVDHLYPGIVFKIGRNDNNSIYFERNDINRSRSRISDNEWARLGFRGFYYRMTMDMGVIVIPPPQHTTKIQLPHDVIVEETDNENHQCFMCVSNKINIKFMPCCHAVGCSDCYIKMDKNECPICKKGINFIVKI